MVLNCGTGKVAGPSSDVYDPAYPESVPAASDSNNKYMLPLVAVTVCGALEFIPHLANKVVPGPPGDLPSHTLKLSEASLNFNRVIFNTILDALHGVICK